VVEVRLGFGSTLYGGRSVVEVRLGFGSTLYGGRSVVEVRLGFSSTLQRCRTSAFWYISLWTSMAVAGLT
jgi:hypothetical protein